MNCKKCDKLETEKEILREPFPYDMDDKPENPTCPTCGKIQKEVTTNLNQAANKFIGQYASATGQAMTEGLIKMRNSAQTTDDRIAFNNFRNEVMGLWRGAKLTQKFADAANKYMKIG